MSSEQSLLQITPYPDEYIHPIDARVGVIGSGNFGLSIALALHEIGILSSIVVRNPEKQRELRSVFSNLSNHEKTSVTIYPSIDQLSVLPDILILAVPDNAIQICATMIAQHHTNALPKTTIFHCSGALGLEELESCNRFGARTIAAHPFETFAYVSTRTFLGIGWGIECEQQHQSFASHFVKMLRGIPIFLSNESRAKKALYHISAVMASNYVYALIGAAQNTAKSAEIPSQILLPSIIRTSVDNSLTAIAHGGNPPLTGPIARGDISTIVIHLDALSSTPHLSKQYCYFGLATCEYAYSNKLISEEIYDNIVSIFEESLDSYRIG